MASVFIRTLVVYVTLIAVMRFLGKRQIGEMQVSELVTAFLLSELASTPLTSADLEPWPRFGPHAPGLGPGPSQGRTATRLQLRPRHPGAALMATGC